MPKTLQIRDVDDEVYDELRARAADEGLSVPEFLRREIARLVQRPSMKQWLEMTRMLPTSDVTSEDVIASLDEMRGPWPDAGR